MVHKRKGKKMKTILASIVAWVAVAIFYLWAVENWRMGCAITWLAAPFLAIATVKPIERLGEMLEE